MTDDMKLEKERNRAVKEEKQHYQSAAACGRLMTCTSWNFIYTAPYKTRLQAGLQVNLGLNISRPKQEIGR